MAIVLGSEEYLNTLSHLNGGSGVTKNLFCDVFNASAGDLLVAKSIRQPEFYGSVYKKMKIMLGNLSIDGESSAAQKEAVNFPGALVTTYAKTELKNLQNTNDWLFDQTLNDELIGTVITAIFPCFLFHVYDSMKISESKYETNEFEYLYYLSVLKPLLEGGNIGTSNIEKMKSGISRWWLFYVIHSLRDEAKSAALEFHGQLGLSNVGQQINNLIVYDASKFIVYRMRNKIREHLLSCLNEGTGNTVYEYVRKYLDEISIVRHAHSEVGRLDLNLVTDANGSYYKFNVTDRSKWLKHKKRIANSFSHQMYSINHQGLLEAQLDTREISSFITSNFAFSEGAETKVEFVPDDFFAIALDPTYYIDINRISAYVNENGFNVPNMIESLAINYNTSYKDLWFSANPVANFSGPISALDLKHKMDMMHLSKGALLKVCGEEFEFQSAVVAELGMKMLQRVWALVIPETSVTGNLQIVYDNAFGTPLIEGISDEGNTWYTTELVQGLNVTLYNNAVPVIAFLDALKIDNIAVDRSSQLIIGKELLMAFYSILASFNIEGLKTQMIPWLNTLDVLPTDRDVYPEWTSAKGQANAAKRFKGFGNLVMEHQCVKSVFNQTNSSQLNNALVKALSIIIAYKTDSIQANAIIQSLK